VADIASDVGIFMQNVRTRQSTGSIAGIAACAQSVGCLGLNPDLVRRHSEEKSFYANWGLGRKSWRWHYNRLLVSMNPVILFTNGGHWVLWR